MKNGANGIFKSDKMHEICMAAFVDLLLLERYKWFIKIPRKEFCKYGDVKIDGLVLREKKKKNGIYIENILYFIFCTTQYVS